MVVVDGGEVAQASTLDLEIGDTSAEVAGRGEAATMTFGSEACD
jgi:hypothetical protein